jgi:glucose/arabinose dehydrogenase
MNACLRIMILCGLLAGCGEHATLPEAAGTGPGPTLPPPNPTMFPTVNIAPAVGWREGETPSPSPGLAVQAFATGLDQQFHGGAFIGQHGSWNRDPRSGYRVAFVPFENGRPAGPLKDVLTGFVDEQGNAQGRPVGVAIDREGALLVADDVGNVVWRLTPS